MATHQAGQWRPWRTVDAMHLAVFSFGLVALTMALHTVVLPLKVLQVAPEEMKNTYLGLVAFAGLLMAVVTQPVAGHVSDRTSTPWGRRRPFMVSGTVLAVLLMLGLGLAGNYLLLIPIALALQFSSNVAQGPYQALLRDLVPALRRGEAASIKVLADTLGGLTFIALIALVSGSAEGVTDPRLLWHAIVLPLAVLVTTLGWTLATVREVPFTSMEGATPAAPSAEASDSGKPHPDFLWFLFSRLAIVTAVSVMQTYSLFFLQDKAGQQDPVAAMGVVGIAAGATLCLGVLLAARLPDSIARRHVVAFSAVVGALGTLALLAASNLVYIVLVASVLGLAAGAFLATNWALAMDMVSRRWAARQLGVVNIATAGGAALAKLSGIGIDQLNQQSEGLGYSVVLVVVGSLFFVGAGLILRVRPWPQEHGQLAKEST